MKKTASNTRVRKLGLTLEGYIADELAHYRAAPKIFAPSRFKFSDRVFNGLDKIARRFAKADGIPLTVARGILVSAAVRSYAAKHFAKEWEEACASQVR